jgi:hypothetical protein
MTLEIKFTHSYRFGYLWQSICPECYKTVAESREEGCVAPKPDDQSLVWM